jgi:hypothetical protein
LIHHEVFLEELRKRLESWDSKQCVGGVFLDTVSNIIDILGEFVLFVFVFFNLFEYTLRNMSVFLPPKNLGNRRPDFNVGIFPIVTQGQRGRESENKISAHRS